MDAASAHGWFWHGVWMLGCPRSRRVSEGKRTLKSSQTAPTRRVFTTSAVADNSCARAYC
jgi:hypothetical protein